MVTSYAKLPDKFDLEQHQCVCVPAGTVQTGLQNTMVDIFIEHDELEEAYFCGIDLAEELVDRLSFLSYGPSYSQMVSVTVPEVRRNDQFEIAVSIAYYQRSCIQLSPGDIESLSNKPNDETSIALRMFRKGVSAVSPYQSLADLWTAIEAVSDKSAKEAGKFVEHTCPNPECKTKRQAGPASQGYIRQHFTDAKAADMKDEVAISAANETREARGKVIHGGRLQDASLRRDVENKLLFLQASTAVALVKELNVKPKSRECQRLGLPYLSLQMIAVGPADFKPVEPCTLKFPFGVSQLPSQFSDAQPVQFDVGITFPINMPKEAYPVVTEAA